VEYVACAKMKSKSLVVMLGELWYMQNLCVRVQRTLLGKSIMLYNTSGTSK
jgi:hypothetical protein